jgi:hypothetical protein
LNHQAGQATDTSGDDDVIYVNIPRKKPQVKAAGDAVTTAVLAENSKKEDKEPDRATGLGYTLALAGLPLAALGSHAAVSSIYKKYKKKRLQAQLDDAQQVHLDLMSKRADTKVRDTGASLGNMIYTVPAAALLTALASGVLTNKVLDKQFPLPQRAQSTRPKRLVVREEPEEDMIKSQSLNDEAYEGLLRTVLEFPGTVELSGLADLVKAAAAGRCEEILRASDESPDTAFEMVKGASSDVPGIKSDLAIAWLVREPETAPWVKLAAALEFFDNAPIFCALARELDEDAQEQAVKLAAEFCQHSRAERYRKHVQEDFTAAVKSANQLVDILQNALEGGAPAGANKDVAEGADERDPEVVLGNTSSIDSREDPDKLSLHTRGNKARKFADTNKDLIDDVFAPERKNKGEQV